MNLPAPIICDAIKIAYRQTKDGFVVSFAIHPQDMPADLANADIGSQWQMRLVTLDDDGNPKEVMPAATLRPRTETPPASMAKSPPMRAPIAPDKRLTQRAGILSNDPDFQLWLSKTNTSWRIMSGTNEEKAAMLVRVYCGVKSRREIQLGTQAADLWDEMLGKFEAWKACLEDAAS